MGIAARRQKVSRQFRLETLEGRALQSVIRPHAIVAESRAFAASAEPISTILGTVRGLRAPAGLQSPAPPGYLSFSGNGTATHVGGVFFGDAHVETPVSTLNQTFLAITHGTSVLTLSHGGKIEVNYAGTAQIVNSHSEIFTLQGKVMSGTSQFNGVTGNFMANGTVNTATGRVTLTFAVTLNYPVPS